MRTVVSPYTENPTTPLLRDFYLRSPEQVARDILGKVVVRTLPQGVLRARIVETEAYLGVGDEAAHAFVGKTERNAVLFGPPGHAYVYFIYGMYYCLNLSCEPEGEAGCVLIRALEPLSGIEQMSSLRGLEPTADPRLLTSGPGRLCQALNITRKAINGMDVTLPVSPLRVVSDGFVPTEITATPRIGIRRAVEHPLRFHIHGNRYVTRTPRPRP